MLTEDSLHQRLGPHLRFILPLHFGGTAGIIGQEDPVRGKQYPNGAGAANLGKFGPDLFNLSGCIEGRSWHIQRLRRGSALREEDMRLFIPENRHIRPNHGDDALCNSV